MEKGIGVRIRRSGGIGSDYNLTLNGMGGNSIRYYVDGIPMAAKGESFSLENIPASIVDRVEVYKGVVPAYLGGDALGGAINIVTNESKKNYYDISYRVGSFNTHQVDFNAQIIEPKTGLTFKPSVGYNFSKNNYTMKGVRVLNPERMNLRQVTSNVFTMIIVRSLLSLKRVLQISCGLISCMLRLRLLMWIRTSRRGLLKMWFMVRHTGKIAHGILVYAIVRKTSLRKDSHYRLMLHIRGRNLRPWIRQW